MTEESAIKKEICDYLETFPNRILFTVTPPKRTRYTSRYMRVGWPDIYGIVRRIGGRGFEFLPMAVPFFIEVKTPTGTLSIEQHKILERARAMGAIAVVATGVEDVRRGLSL